MKLSKFLFFGGGFLIILISIYGFFLLLNRPGLPVNVNPKAVIRLDDTWIKSPQDIDFILSRKMPGEKAAFYLKKPSGEIEKVEEKVARFYSSKPFPFIYFFIGIFSFLMGLIVYFFRPQESRARLFYWLALLFGSSVIISGEYYCLRPSWTTLLPGILFLIAYPLVFALLLNFSLTFIKKKLSWEKLLIYGPAIIFIGLLEAAFLYSALKPSIDVFRLYHTHFYIFRLYAILAAFLSILILFFSYRKSRQAAEKAQLAWIGYGLFLGIMPFLIFYQLPNLLGIKPWLSEELSSAFFAFVPLAFAISILKFRLFDIHLVINRSLVYSLLTIITVSIYLLVVQIFQNLFSRLILNQKAPINLIHIIGLLAAAAAFHPAREKIQTIVDRTFYRLKYDYKKCVLQFNEKARRIFNQEELAELLFRTINQTLPVEKIALSIVPLSHYGLKISRSQGKIDLNELDRLDQIRFYLPIDFEAPFLWAMRKSIEMEEKVDFSAESWLQEKGWSLVFLLPFKSTTQKGFLALGEKKSGERFSREDLELLHLLVEGFTLNLERIRLQEEVIYERAEQEKLMELNRLKTEFVSAVSHELRTPLSSLQCLAEMLHSGKVKEAKRKEQILSLLEEESKRLARLLRNILDFGKIEENVKTYSFQRTHLQPLLEETVSLFSYSLKADGFSFQLAMPEEPIYLEVDSDALKQALINLLDNAIKYSREEKEISVALLDKEKEVEIQVKDKGIGIPAEELDKIFANFYRCSEASRLNPQGVGLGLKIVKHIMDAHGGQVKVESQVNQGSKFILIFPKP